MDPPKNNTSPVLQNDQQTVPLFQNQLPKHKANIVSIIVLLLVLFAIPMTVIYLGQQTRQEIKAAQLCKTPAIPDPSDCAGGSWKLYKDAAGCIHFRCTLQ